MALRFHVGFGRGKLSVVANWLHDLDATNRIKADYGQLTLVQPIIPFSLTAEWNLITRTIIQSSTQNRPSRAPTPRAGCATSLQLFVSYSTKTHTTFGLNTESAYDWEHSQWTVPINLTVSQLLKIGGPDWGLRLTVTFLFPKRPGPRLTAPIWYRPVLSRVEGPVTSTGSVRSLSRVEGPAKQGCPFPLY